MQFLSFQYIYVTHAIIFQIGFEFMYFNAEVRSWYNFKMLNKISSWLLCYTSVSPIYFSVLLSSSCCYLFAYPICCFSFSFLLFYSPDFFLFFPSSLFFVVVVFFSHLNFFLDSPLFQGGCYEHKGNNNKRLSLTFLPLPCPNACPTPHYSKKSWG